MQNQIQSQEVSFSSEMTLKDLTPNVAALLSYLVGWVTGIIFLVLEQKNRYVRFHALQSIIVFGSLTVAGSILSNIPFVGTGFAVIVSVTGFVLWLILMIKANQGTVLKLPWAGNLAEKLTLESMSKTGQNATASAEAVNPSASSGQASPNDPGVITSRESSNSAYHPSAREEFQRRYYSTAARTGRIVGSSFAIAWCLALLIFFNFFNQYIAYYQSAAPGHWQVNTLVTSDFNLWLPILNTTLALAILAHALFIVYDNYLLRKIARLVLGVFSLATIISLLVIFPFDFNVIPNADASYWGPIGLSVTLILAAIGTGIGILVRFIQLIVHLAQGKY